MSLGKAKLSAGVGLLGLGLGVALGAKLKDGKLSLGADAHAGKEDEEE